MAHLPRGTVTFVFTDIEGSTRLIARLRDRYAGLLAEHHRVLRAAFGRHGGHEVQTEGDAFFVAFAGPGDAVAATVAAQRELAALRTRAGVELQVRMGVHTGEALVQDDDYVGLDVHRAARICAAGHGGQVLVSGATRERLGDALPADLGLRDLGEFRLRDLDAAQRLFQVVADDLAADFPPLRAAGGHALPRPRNRTIGRERDVRAIVARLRAGDRRLLTLVGPGGVGKTRLALEAGHAAEADFADGAWLVALAALRHADEVPRAVVQALAIPPLPGERAEAAVTRFLAAKQLLIVLDNVEHLPGAAPFVSELLVACPAVTVLATSREPLGLDGEERFPVAPLARDPATDLFAERARAHDPAFAGGGAAVAEICRRLDGLPLAIELAAARCALLSPEEIAERLGEALAVLGRGPSDAPARQQTLRAAIDWSHELLGERERAHFARFAVFAGGATIAAAEAVTRAGLDDLDALTAKSLLVARRRAGGPTRLIMLETIRAYAAERLAATDEQVAHREHFRHFLALARNHGAERALLGRDREEHLAALDADVDNLHAALAWVVRAGEGRDAVAMAAALGWYWMMCNRDRDAIAWTERALGVPGADADPAAQLEALGILARTLRWAGRAAELPRVAADMLAIARRVGDPVLLARALRACADADAGVGNMEASATHADEALRWATAAGDRWEIAAASYDTALSAVTVPDLRRRVDQAAALMEEVGNVHRRTVLFASAAYHALCLGDARAARDLVDRAAASMFAADDPFMSMILQGNRGLAALLSGDASGAAVAFREELELARELLALPIAAEGLVGLAAIAALHGDDRRAALLVGAAGAHEYAVRQDEILELLDARFLAAARGRSGAEAWDAAAHEGATLGFDAAIAAALAVPAAG